MNQEDFNRLVRDSFGSRMAIFEKKGHDYATEDCLSNFKRMSALCKLLRINLDTPKGTALFYIVMKLDRLTNLINKGEAPANESLEDTINDMQNYIDLFRGLLYEKA